jgi:tetratricopeptide (TPR) repeat protein
MRVLIGLLIVSASWLCETGCSERVASSTQSTQQGEKASSNANPHDNQPVSGEDHYYKANNLKEALEPEEALKEYRLALESGYDTVELRIELGSLLAGPLKRQDEAVEQFRIATQRAQGDWRAHWPLAQSLLDTKQYDEALREIEVADGLDPEGHADGFYLFYRAKALDGLERYREALEEYEAFLKRNDDIGDTPKVHDARERVRNIRRELNVTK